MNYIRNSFAPEFKNSYPFKTSEIMKTITAIILGMVFFASTAFAQETTENTDQMHSVFGKSGKSSVGWFISGNSSETRFGKSDVHLAGLGFGLIIDHTFTIGVAGFGIADCGKLSYNNFLGYDKVYLEGGYGGLLLEYTLFPRNTIHVSFPVVIGAGGLDYSIDKKSYDWEDGDWDTDRESIDSDAFFVIEPGVKAELNVFKWMRLGAGISYRYTPDLNLHGTSSSLINSFSIGGSLKFGKF
jgi:hypothetical protein